MPFKDTKEGSTHYQNDGCGEPAHNMTHYDADFKELREEFQKFADNIVWSNNDGSEKYIGVGNMADWWIEKLSTTRQALLQNIIEKIGEDVNLENVDFSKFPLFAEEKIKQLTQYSMEDINQERSRLRSIVSEMGGNLKKE